MPITLSLPLDLTGTNPVNHVNGEPHTVTGLEDAIFALNFGPFYTLGLKVFSTTLNRYLDRNTEYVALHYYEEPSLKSGLEVCCVIYIKNPAHYGSFLVEYHAVGGEFVNMTSIIEQLIENLAVDNRPVNWGDLIGAPDSFPPAAHMHDLGDLYGFEYLTEALDNLSRSITMGDQAKLEELFIYIDQTNALLLGQVQAFANALNAHESSIANPHQTTKAQVGLGNVLNYGIATKVVAEAGTDNASYMTPLRVKEAIIVQAIAPLNNHVSNTNNPHSVTKAQVGLGSVENWPVASLSEGNAGTANRYLSAAVGLSMMDTKDAAVAQAAQTALNNVNNALTTLINNHANNTSNPHQTTKAQVGLGNVLNYGIATQPQAEAGTDNATYMTPLRVAQYVGVTAIAQLNNHINNLSNPHNTTKAQVGLGSVDNFATASLVEARNGTASRFMNASVTRDLINELALSIAQAQVNAHASNTNNPHNTTKAQVGLGSVENYGIATTTQANNGVDDNAYMTPLKVAQAIASRAPIRSFQGRTEAAAQLYTTDRLALGLGNSAAVDFGTLRVGNVIVNSASANSLTMFSNFANSGWLQRSGFNNRNVLMPSFQGDDASGRNTRLLSTQYLKVPYAYAKRVVVAAATTSLEFSGFDYSFKNIQCSTGTPLSITLNLDNGPYAARDKDGTEITDGTNEWGYSLTLILYPGSRTINWANVNWGSAGAPALIANTNNIIILTNYLLRNEADGGHYFGGWHGTFVGGGF